MNEILRMPEVPTVEEVENMTDRMYKDTLDKFYSFTWQAIGAIAVMKCDLFDIRYNNPSINDKINDLINHYEELIDKSQNVTDWLLKVRHFGYKGDFQNEIQ